MLNSIQRKLLIIGISVGLAASLIFVCNIQQFYTTKALTEKAEQDVDAPLIFYLTADISNGYVRMSMRMNHYDVMSESLGNRVLMSPVTQCTTYNGALTATTGNSDENIAELANVFGVSEKFPAIKDLTMTEGEFFTRQDCDNLEKVCVLSQELVDFYGIEYEKDMTVMINSEPYRVSGVFAYDAQESNGSNFFAHTSGNGQIIMLPYTTAVNIENMRLNDMWISQGGEAVYTDGEINEYSSISYILGKPLSEVTSQDELINLKSELKDIVNSLDIEKGEFDGYEAYIDIKSESESDGGIQGNMLAVAAVTFISMLLMLTAGLNIIQIATAAVYNNQSRIALKMALGATPKNISRELANEILILSVKGGYIGLALTGVLIMLLNKASGQYLFSFNIYTATAGMAAVIFLTWISVFLPAKSISKLQPAQAIKESE